LGRRKEKVEGKEGRERGRGIQVSNFLFDEGRAGISFIY